MIIYHPLFAAGAVTLPMLVMLLSLANTMDRGESYEAETGGVRVVESQCVLGSLRSSPTVAVIGTLTNASRVSWDEIRFHVDFLDSAGRQTDTGVNEARDLLLPAGAATSFKVSFPREFPETNYAKAVVRIVGAKDVRARW